jgi:RNA polymerase sigma-70 factor (ECF subfamily)
LNEAALISSNRMQPEAGNAAVENEDVELVKKCQSGDTQAFNQLVTKYRGKAFAMIYNMVRNEQDAWDLAQDGFLKAWKSIGNFRGQSAFYTWLYRIMSNVSIDWLRKKKIEGAVELDDAIELKDIAAGSATSPKAVLMPDEKIGHDEIRRRIDAALEKLSPEHRAVIVMKEIDGLQYHEIAAALDCSIGTVMSRIFYARKKLQTMLKDLHENV